MKKTLLLFFTCLLATSVFGQSETTPYLYLKDKNGDVEKIRFTDGNMSLNGSLIRIDTPEESLEYGYDDIAKFYFKNTELREGKYRNIVIYISFPDAQNFSRSKNEIESLFNSGTSGESLYSYFRDISGEKFHIRSSFFPESNTSNILSYEADQLRLYYDLGLDDGGPAAENELLMNALNAAKDEIETKYTAEELDYDDDGMVDLVTFIVQGAPYPKIFYVFCPHAGSLGDFQLHGKTVGSYTLIAETAVSTSILVHETYHTLGAPDLYCYDATTYGITPAGFDIMGGGEGSLESSLGYPQSSLAHITQSCGKFIPEIPEITKTGTYTLYDSWDRTGKSIAWKITSPTSNCGEFFVFEYRQRDGTVYESGNICEGILISRINPTVSGNGKSNGTDKPFGVYLYREKGTYHNNGDLDNACFKLDGLNYFDDFSSPRAFLSDNSPIGGLGGIVIDQFSEAGGDSMTFRVTFPDSDIWEIGKPNLEDVIAWLKDGVLTITGEGDMLDWGPDNYPPWYDYRKQITKVDILLDEYNTIGVTNIGDYAFFCKNAGYEKLIEVNIPPSVQSIGMFTFSNCQKLQSVKIPESVENIKQAAFALCTDLENVIIPHPNSITNIDEQAFYGCSKLQSFTFPAGVPIIKQFTFANCTKLKSMTILDGVTSIQNNAFAGCPALEIVEIPKSVTSIGTELVSMVFAYCTGLTDIYVFWEKPPAIMDNTFEGVEPRKDVNLHIPCIYYDNYKNAPVWKDFHITGEPQTVTLSADPPSYGTAEKSDDYPCGEEITITATPNIGRKFVNWTENIEGVDVEVSTSANFTFLVKEPRNLVAHFEIESYTIALEADPLGAAILTGAGIYNFDSLAIVTALYNNECYTFGGWWEEGIDTAVCKTSEYKFFVYNSRTLTAKLIPIPYEISLLANPEGGGDVVSSGFYDCGSTITVTATPEFGYEFVNWTENGTEVSTDNPFQFTVTGPRILTANFKLKTYEIILIHYPEDGGTTSGGGTYTHGDEITVHATPNDCYSFLYWTDKYENIVFSDPDFPFTVYGPDTLFAVFNLKSCDISVVADPPEFGMAIGGGTYECGSPATVLASEVNDPCITFTGWTKDDDVISTNLSFQFDVTEEYCPSTLVAHFEIKTLEVFVIANPEEGGKVEGDGTYNCGTPVTITATVGECYNFVNWTVNGNEVSDQVEYTFTVTPELIELFPNGYSLVANFEVKTLDIFVEVNPTDGGAVSGNGNYNCGEVKELLATPNECYRFDHWSSNDEEVSTDNPYFLTLISDTTLVANFEKIHYSITVIEGANGTVSPNGALTGGIIDVECDDDMTFTFIPEECYQIAEVLIDGINDPSAVTDGYYTFEKIAEDHTISVLFEKIPYTITVTEGSNGTVSPNGALTGGIIDVECDDDMTFTFTPDDCYQIAEVLIDGINDPSAVTNGYYTFENITEDRTISVAFEKIPYTITVIEGSNGTVSPNGALTDDIIDVECGDDLTFTFIPDDCYQVAEVLIDGISDPSAVANGEFTFENITEEHTISVSFEKKLNTVTVSATQPAYGTAFGGGSFICGDTITITATPYSCYSFTYWTKEGVEVSTDNPYTFVVTENMNLIAHFTDSAKITVMVNPSGVGTVTGGGLHSCGQTISLTATAIDDCYKFVNWTNEEGDTISPNNPYIFTVTGSKTLIANFELKKFNVYVIADPTGGGTVSDGGNYNCGDTATVTAIPANCYHFVSWTTIDNVVVSTQPLYEFPVTELSILFAHFAKDTCVIILAANPPAGGNPIGSGTYECGKSAVAMAGTNSCYTFINWTKNGQVVSTQENYPFTVEETCTLIANFTLNSYYIAVSPDPPTGGLAIESGNYNCGDTVSVIAIPFSDYRFVNWTENGAVVSTNSTYTFEVTAARDLVAHFALKTYEITVQIDPDATCGEVSGGGTYNLGDIATVKADTGLCCKFLYWMEGVNVVSIDNPYSFPVAEPRTLVAKFESNTFDVSLVANPQEGGEAFYEENYCDTVTVTAIPNECWEFVNWTDETGVEVSNTLTYTFPITEDCNLTANFIQITYNIIVVSDPLTGGTVSVNDTTIFCVSDGTSLTIEAFPEECYTFIGWWTQNGDPLSTDNPYTFNVIKSDTLVAKFEIKSFTVNLSADPSTGGTVSGDGTYNCGDTITITATPNDCWAFTGWWTQDNILVSEDNPYTLVVTEDITLVAHFTDSSKITVVVNPPGVGTVSGDGFYLCYQTAILTAIAIDDCYKFVNWTNEDGDTISPNNPYIFAVTGSQTLHANFALKNFNVYVLADPTGSGTVSGDGNYSCGDTATLTAIPANCYHFVNWTINDVEVSTQPLYEFPVTGLSILVAHFAKDTCVITLLANPPAGGNPIGSGSYECGKPAVAMAGTNSCYTFSNWMKNGQIISTQENYPFTVEETCTLIANFTLNSYSITVLPDPLNGGLAIESGTHNCGDTVSVIAIPFSNYNFINWTENGQVVSTNSTYTFEVTAARNLVAHFALKTGEITVQIAPAECNEDSVSGGGIYNLGEIATVTVISNPNSCCNFKGWMENGVYIYLEPVYSFEVTGSCTLVAKFERKTHDITLSAEPSTGGSASGSGTDILCGETFTVTAIPADCYSFVNWSNENGEVVSTDNPWSFEVRKNSNLTANFVLNYYDVTVVAEPTAGGAASGGGTDIPCDSLITVAATPETCYTFAGWWTQDGNFVTTNNPYTFNVIKSDTLVAHFEIIGFNILLSKEPSGGGTVSGDGVYDCGTTVSISATPDSCYTFVNWTTDDGTFVSNDANLTFEATNDTAFVAHFEIKSFDVILSADPLAGGTVAGEGTYDCGTEITIIATPDTGYVFVNWTTQNGTSVSNDANYKFEVINDCTLVAHFESKTFEVNLEINTIENCGGEVKGGGSYKYGDNVTVVATVAGECCGFANWTINGVVVSTNIAYTFTVTESVTLTANFEIPQYRVTLLSQDTTYGTTVGTGLYKACSTVRIRAHEQDCYTFANWTTTDGKEITKNAIYEFVVTKDTTLIANFSALDFDTYSATLWCNTFILNLNALSSEYSKVEDCKWYIDGKVVYDTQTIDQFSYSAGPNFDDKLMCGVPYMFKVKLENRTNWLCSTPKTIMDPCCNAKQNESSKSLVIFPNPTMSNNSFTVENVIVGQEVQVYNQFGVCINSIIASGDVISMTLNVPSGIYMIRSGERNGKIVVIR